MAAHIRAGAAGLAAIAAVLVSGSACSAGQASSPAAAPAPPAAASTASPSASAQPPTKAGDLAAAKRALITAKELGDPWVAVKTVNSVGGKDEACPGKPTTDATVKPLASATARFTAGRAKGAGIGVFGVSSYADSADVATFREALPKVLAACASYTDASKMYVVLKTTDGPAIDGADATWQYAERVYYDAKHTKLAYARHYVIALHGRAVSAVQYAFLTEKSDPNANDFSRTEQMARKQLANVQAEFSEN
ncbi:hypothetical protein [Microlunatus ginsengisoli]|uniref:PknH-like extracellular domain-containing protein n=1 Tax=Microlunatus ginsengisoli TaxID=363863 RepID=A0ABP7AAZ2_9ACTN